MPCTRKTHYIEVSRPCSVDVVSGDHPDGYSSSLALADGLWNFGPDWILDTNDAKAGHVVHDLFLILPVWVIVDVNLKKA